MDKILLVEDDAGERRQMAMFLKNRGFKVLNAANSQTAQQLLAQSPDIIVANVNVTSNDGLTLLRQSRQHLPETPVIITTGCGTIASVVEAMKEGAFDYLAKPINPEVLLLAIKRAAEQSQLKREVRHLREQVRARGGLFGIVGNSQSMRRVFDQIQLVAPTRSTDLISGESGTGKELVARAIHDLSPRKDGPFIILNCAAIPKDLAESELFGHSKGAFTGATENRLGKFAAADRGTLLIDEIGEMELPIQAKLLRALETHTISPLGSNEDYAIDVRVVAATHRNLRELVDQGKFREDLYYRLHVVCIDLPPLRQRPEDIPLLVAVFLQQLNQEYGRNVQEIAFGTMDALQGYRWPGNVRELRNVLEAIVVLTQKEVIELADLPRDISEFANRTRAAGYGSTGALAEMERGAIQSRLIETRGNRKQTAELLGISTRTLLRKIRSHGLEDPRRSSAPASDGDSTGR